MLLRSCNLTGHITMKAETNNKSSESKKRAKKPASDKEIKSDILLSERDEVKQAEQRTAKAITKKT